MNRKSRIAGAFYLLCIITGIPSQMIRDALVSYDSAATTVASIAAHTDLFRLSFVLAVFGTAAYIVVTALFYELFKPVNPTISLLAAFFSAIGCATGIVSCALRASAIQQPESIVVTLIRLGDRIEGTGIILFGFYCLMIGWLIYRSTFLPRALGVLMMLSGLGWLTFLWQPLAHALFPWNVFVCGLLGEGSLTLWLLFKGARE